MGSNEYSCSVGCSDYTCSWAVVSTDGQGEHVHVELTVAKKAAA